MTSGTTGPAKTIIRTQASWIASFGVNQRTFGITSADCYAILGQITHSVALYAVLEAGHIGARLALLAGMSPRSQAQMIRRLRPTILYATPAQLRLLCLSGAVCPSLRRVVFGGGLVTAEDLGRFGRVFPGAQLTQFYGAAETSFVAWTNKNTPPGSVGRAYPGVDLRTEPDGAITVRSPYEFAGHDPLALDIQPRTDRLSTGEYGFLDEDGNLFINGRRDRMVTIADRNVFLDQVEAVITSLPGVRHCAVFAEPNALRGKHLVAAVEGAWSDDHMVECRVRLGPLVAPRKVHEIGRFPVTSSGKPDLSAVRSRIAGG